MNDALIFHDFAFLHLGDILDLYSLAGSRANITFPLHSEYIHRGLLKMYIHTNNIEPLCMQ